MKKIFGGKSAKGDTSGSLEGKTVQVGQFHVRVETLLGQGGYAEIYQVKEVNTGDLFALKHLRLAGHPEHVLDVQREARTMYKLKGHPNVLHLHTASFAGPKNGETDGFFLLDYCPATLLEVMQARNFQLSDRMVLHVFGCVCCAVMHMHTQSPPLAHRDIKAENILQLPDGSWVLCDYGSATARAQVYDTTQEIAAEEEVIRKHTTPAYRPPEMWDLLMRQPVDTKVDIWALGVLLFVLCFGRLPFQGDSKLQILYAKYDMPPGRHPQMRALIRAMLTPTPTERPDIKYVLEQLVLLVQLLQQPLPEAYHKTLAAALARVGGSPPTIAAPAVTGGTAQVSPTKTPGGRAAAAPAAAAAAAAAANGAAYFGVKEAMGAEAAASRPQVAGSSSSSSAAHGASSPQPSAASQAAAEWNPSFPGGHVPAAAAASTAPAAAALPLGAARPVVPPRSTAAQRAQEASRGGTSAVAAASGAGNSGTSSTSNNSSSSNVQRSQPSQQQQHQQPVRRVSDHAMPGGHRGTPAAGVATASLRPGQGSPRGGSGSSGGGSIQRPSAAVEAALAADTPAGGASSNGQPTSAGDSRQQQQQQQQQQRQQPAPTAGPLANGALLTASSVASSTANGTPASSSAAAAPAVASGSVATRKASGQLDSYITPSILQAGLSGVKDSLLMELDLLRSQVRALSDQNQAFVFRIKQLEDYVVQQKDEMSELRQAVSTLQQQALAAPSSSAAAAGSAADAQEQQQRQHSQESHLSDASAAAAADMVLRSSSPGQGLHQHSNRHMEQERQQQQGPRRTSGDAVQGSGQRSSGTFWNISHAS